MKKRVPLQVPTAQAGPSGLNQDETAVQEENNELEEEEEQNIPEENPRILKLERALEKCYRKIKRLGEKEVDFDDEECSTYMSRSRYEKRAVQIFTLICNLKGSSKHAGRYSEKKVKFNGTKFPEVNKLIQRWLNKTGQFPDFADVVQLLKKEQQSLNLSMSSEGIKMLADQAFQEIGKIMKKRRCMDFVDSLEALDPGDNDPALTHPELEAKLQENHRNGSRKIQQVIDSFAHRQIAENLEAKEVPDDAPLSDVDVDEPECGEEEEEEGKGEEENVVEEDITEVSEDTDPDSSAVEENNYTARKTVSDDSVTCGVRQALTPVSDNTPPANDLPLVEDVETKNIHSQKRKERASSACEDNPVLKKKKQPIVIEIDRVEVENVNVKSVLFRDDFFKSPRNVLKDCKNVLSTRKHCRLPSANVRKVGKAVCNDWPKAIDAVKSPSSCLKLTEKETLGLAKGMVKSHGTLVNGETGEPQKSQQSNENGGSGSESAGERHEEGDTERGVGGGGDGNGDGENPGERKGGGNFDVGDEDQEEDNEEESNQLQGEDIEGGDDGFHPEPGMEEAIGVSNGHVEEESNEDQGDRLHGEEGEADDGSYSAEGHFEEGMEDENDGEVPYGDTDAEENGATYAEEGMEEGEPEEGYLQQEMEEGEAGDGNEVEGEDGEIVGEREDGSYSDEGLLEQGMEEGETNGEDGGGIEAEDGELVGERDGGSYSDEGQVEEGYADDGLNEGEEGNAEVPEDGEMGAEGSDGSYPEEGLLDQEMEQGASDGGEHGEGVGDEQSNDLAVADDAHGEGTTYDEGGSGDLCEGAEHDKEMDTCQEDGETGEQGNDEQSGLGEGPERMEKESNCESGKGIDDEGEKSSHEEDLESRTGDAESPSADCNDELRHDGDSLHDEESELKDGERAEPEPKDVPGKEGLCSGDVEGVRSRRQSEDDVEASRKSTEDDSEEKEVSSPESTAKIMEDGDGHEKSCVEFPIPRTDLSLDMDSFPIEEEKTEGKEEAVAAEDNDSRSTVSDQEAKDPLADEQGENDVKVDLIKREIDETKLGKDQLPEVVKAPEFEKLLTFKVDPPKKPAVRQTVGKNKSVPVKVPPKRVPNRAAVARKRNIAQVSQSNDIEVISESIAPKITCRAQSDLSADERVKRFLQNAGSSLSITVKRKRPISEETKQALEQLKKLKNISATRVTRGEPEIMVIGEDRPSTSRQVPQPRPFQNRPSPVPPPRPRQHWPTTPSRSPMQRGMSRTPIRAPLRAPMPRPQALPRVNGGLPFISSVQSVRNVSPRILSVRGSPRGFRGQRTPTPMGRGSPVAFPGRGRGGLPRGHNPTRMAPSRGRGATRGGPVPFVVLD